MLLSLLALLACASDPTDSGDSGDTESDADTDADSDTDTDADTDVGTELTYVINGEATGTLTLTYLDLFGAGDATVWQTAEVTDTTQGIRVPIPPPDHLLELDPTNLPGLNAAFYAATVEVDGGHGHSAIAMTAFLDGDVPTGFGWAEGWNALVFSDDEEEAPENIGIDAIPIEPLTFNDTLTFGGTTSVDADRWGLFPGALLEGQPVGSVLVDEALGETWSVTLSGPPPDDHGLPGEEGFVLELPLAYQDLDASEGLSDGDLPLSPACTAEGLTAVLLWAAAPPDGQSAYFAMSQGFPLGWRAIGAGADDEGVDLEGEALTTLAFDGSCSLDD